MQNIIAAAKLIAYDNGAINRTATESQVVTRMVACACNETDPKTVQECEQWLGTLSQEDLEELCTGEQGRVESPEHVGEFLNLMFERC